MRPVRSVGSQVTVNCTVELNEVVVESDFSILVINLHLAKDGNIIPSQAQNTTSISSKSWTYTINSFGRSDSGNYTCSATISPQRGLLTYLIQSERSNSCVVQITTGNNFCMDYYNEPVCGFTCVSKKLQVFTFL